MALRPNVEPERTADGRGAEQASAAARLQFVGAHHIDVAPGFERPNVRPDHLVEDRLVIRIEAPLEPTLAGVTCGATKAIGPARTECPVGIASGVSWAVAKRRKLHPDALRSPPCQRDCAVGMCSYTGGLITHNLDHDVDTIRSQPTH